MSDEWVASLDVNAALVVPAEIRLARALEFLATSYRRKVHLDNGQEAGLVRAASAMIVMDRDRIAGEHRVVIRGIGSLGGEVPSLLGAISHLVTAIEDVEGEAWIHGVKELGWTEAHLRALWAA